MGQPGVHAASAAQWNCCLRAPLTSHPRDLPPAWPWAQGLLWGSLVPTRKPSPESMVFPQAHTCLSIVFSAPARSQESRGSRGPSLDDSGRMTLGVPGACPSQVSVWGVGSQLASFCSRPVAPASWEAIGLDLHPWSAPTAGAGVGGGGSGARLGRCPERAGNVNGKLIYGGACSPPDTELGLY